MTGPPPSGGAPKPCDTLLRSRGGGATPQCDRVVVVLGYSDGGRDVLHPVGAARLARAAEVSTGGRRRRALRVGARGGHTLGGRADGRRLEWCRPGARRRPRRPDDGRQRLQRPGRHRARRCARGRGRDLTLARAPGARRVPAPAVETADPRPDRVSTRAAQPSSFAARAAAVAPPARATLARAAQPADSRTPRPRLSPDDRLEPVAASSPRRGSGSSTRAEGRRPAPPAPRGSRRGSRAPSPPACRRRCRGRTGP